MYGNNHLILHAIATKKNYGGFRDKQKNSDNNKHR